MSPPGGIFPFEPRVENAHYGLLAGDAPVRNIPMAAKLNIPADYGTTRGLSLQAEARELVLIGTSPDGRDIQMSPPTAQAWFAMLSDAADAGIELVAVSGFRSVARQAEIIRAKLSAGETLEGILRTVAAPGYSEHHTGRAIDIAVPERLTLTEDFGYTPAFRWLERHASGHGFRMSYPRDNPHGMVYEPWHWFLLGQ